LVVATLAGLLFILAAFDRAVFGGLDKRDVKLASFP
jgi:hypothetical protein